MLRIPEWVARGPSVVPLGRDASSRYLPWIFALMVYLAVLALAGVLILHSAAARWDRGEVENVTVQVVPVVGQDTQATVERAVQVLRETSGVAEVRALTRAENVALLEPWLGPGNVPRDLPLPRLIDVRLISGVALDTEALAGRLREAGSGITVDDPKLWLERLSDFGQSLEAVALAVVVLIGLAAVGTVIFTTRMGLAIHQGIIELLHLMGARDSYVAQLFQSQALSLGIRGGLIGIVLGAATLVGLQQVAKQLSTPLVPNLSMAGWSWAVLVLVPVVIALIAMLTARVTALRSLSRMP